MKSYWLASPSIAVDSGNAYFGPGSVYEGYAGSGYIILFDSRGVWNIRELAIRPIVSLKSEVTIDNIKVISGSEEEWTGKKPSISPSLEEGNTQEGKIIY